MYSLQFSVGVSLLRKLSAKRTLCEDTYSAGLPKASSVASGSDIVVNAQVEALQLG